MLRDGKIGSVNATFEAIPLSKLRGIVERQAIIGIGHPTADPPKKIIISFGAQFAEVEVNTRTGEIRVVRGVRILDLVRALVLGEVAEAIPLDETNLAPVVDRDERVDVPLASRDRAEDREPRGRRRKNFD